MAKFYRISARHGLTLIELVIVIAIIAILAVMVVPRLDFLKAQAEHASSAATQGDLGSMLQTFKASSGKYPTMDTLIDTSGSLYSKLQGQTAASALEASAIPNASSGEGWYRSLSEAGFSYAYRHNSGAADASNSSSTLADLVNEGASGNLKLATLKATGGGSAATAIRTAIYPGGATYVPAAPATDPDGIPGSGDETPAVPESTTQAAAGTIPATSKLVFFGIGPKSNLVGNILANAPMSSMGADDPATTYCRYFAVFEIFQNGAPAKFRMITDHRLRQIQARVDLYKQGSAVQ